MKKSNKLKIIISGMICLLGVLNIQAGTEGLSGNQENSLIKELGASTWEMREKAQNELLTNLLKNSGKDIKSLAIHLKKETDPEIYYRLKQVLADYYYKKVYNPNKKHGFIGLQLGEGNALKLNGVEYIPIDIIKPQEGFPGEKAGIKAGDQILKVNDQKCSNDFKLRDFILYVADLSPGDVVNLTLYSNKKVVKKKITLVARPDKLQSPELNKDKREYFIIWLKKLIK